MAEIWAAAVATVGSAYLSSRASSRAQKDQNAFDERQTVEGRRTTAYERELDDYYSQLDKQRRRDARISNMNSVPGARQRKLPAMVAAAPVAPGVLPATQKPKK